MQRVSPARRSATVGGAFKGIHGEEGCCRKSTSKIGGLFFSQKWQSRYIPGVSCTCLWLFRGSLVVSLVSSILVSHFYSTCHADQSTIRTKQVEAGVDIDHCY